MNRRFIFSFILGALFGCATPKEEGLGFMDTFSFEVVDSLELDILGDPTMIGVNAAMDRWVFYDFPGKEFVFTDQTGTVVSRFSKRADTPDAFGFLLEFPVFLNDRQVALTGMRGVFIYDLQGHLIKKLSHPESLGSAGFMSFPGKGMKTVTLDGQPFLIGKSVRTRNTFPGEQAFYDRFRALELIDVVNERFMEIVPFEGGSQFLDGNGYYESDYAPAYEVSGNKLYVALGGENRLHVYTLLSSGAALDTIVQLHIPGFTKLPATSREEFSQGTITIKGNTPATRNIHLVDGNVLVHYYGGIPEETMNVLEGLWLSGDEEEAERQYSEAEKEVNQGVLVLDQETLTHKGILKFPDGTNKRGFASGGGYVWMERLPDEENEEDFLRIYKVKMVSR